MEPWHGQTNCLPLAATVQPWCVHTEEKHAAVLAVGRDTRTVVPSASLTDFDPPTGTSASAAIFVPALSLGAVPPGELAQDARTRVPAPAAEAARTVRRVRSGFASMIGPT